MQTSRSFLALLMLALGGTAVWYADALEKVFLSDAVPEQRCPAGPGDTRPVVLKMAPGERQPFQLVLAPSERITARVWAQLTTAAGAVLPAEVRAVGFTNITYPVNRQRRGGLFPDPLLPLPPGMFSPVLEAGRAHSFWVTLSLPPDTMPPPADAAGGGPRLLAGELQLDITTAAGAAPTRTFPLAVRVWRFAVPPPGAASFITGSSWGSGSHYLRGMLPPMSDEAYLDVW